jgi:hypothetical protein
LETRTRLTKLIDQLHSAGPKWNESERRLLQAIRVLEQAEHSKAKPILEKIVQTKLSGLSEEAAAVNERRIGRP